MSCAKLKLSYKLQLKLWVGEKNTKSMLISTFVVDVVEVEVELP